MKKLLLTALLYTGSCSLQAQTSGITLPDTPTVLHTPGGDLHGSLLLPAGKGKMPVVLIIAGSGPTDRNGNNPVMKNESLHQVATALATAGIASVRFDKRGIAASKAAAKSEADLRFDDYVSDAKGWLQQLRSDKRFGKVYVIGHSEGSLVGMLAAQAGADGFISIAGPGRPAAAVLKEQFAAQPPMVKEAALPILDSLAAGKTVAQTPAYLASLFRASVQPYMISWFRYDPAQELAKLKVPVLIVQGTTDLQVSTADAESLAKAQPRAKLVLVKDMNHVLKTTTATDRQTNFATYNNPDLPLNAELIGQLITFIQKGN